MAYKNLKNMKFGRLIVIDKIGKNKCGQLIWKCQCSCDNKTIKNIVSSSLLNGSTKSCGCIRNETSSKRKSNKYNLTGTFGIGYTSKNEEFYFDIEDYDIIKCFYWRLNDSGYVITSVKRKNLRMHRIVMNYSGELQIDHRNGIRHDNRKDNLRLATNQQNCFNKSVKGVYFDKSKQRWCARLVKDNKIMLFKRFKNIEDAINARKDAEIKYFGEFARKD
ncbi:MAG: HNH endonuclease [Syntrophothermus sp.]